MTWTERYLAAALRSIPESNRGDVERELRSSIEDGIEERLAAGEDQATAERAVLEGLGDPSKLAASYTGRPNYLIGPDLYPFWRWIMIRIVAVSVPFAVVIVGALELIDGGSMTDALLAAGSAAVSVPVNILCWGTIAFAVIDRAESARNVRADILKMVGPWTLEYLPEPSTRRVSATETAGEIVSILITAGAIAFLRTLTVPGSNGPNELLGGPFTGQLFYLIGASLIARAALHLVAFVRGSWTVYAATINAGLHLLFAVPIVWLALQGTLVNRYFADGIGWPSLPDPAGVPMMAVVFGTILATGWEIVRGYARARGFPNVVAVFRPPRPA